MTVTLLTTADPASAVTTLSNTPADRNPARVYLASLGSPAAKRTMRQALAVSADILTKGALDLEDLPWGTLRFQHTAALQAVLGQRYTVAGANKILSAVRGVLRAAWQLNQMTAEDFHAAAAVKSIKGSQEEPAGRALAAGEILALLDTCLADPTPAGYRDAAVIALLYACGPRRAELVGLDLADMSITEDDGEHWGKLTVRHGKGNKERNLPVAGGALNALQDWLIVRGAAPGPLFVPINKGGVLALDRRLTSQAIYDLLAKRGAAAKLADFSPHDLRRTFISDLLDKGADIATVQKLAGHAQVTTTARYDRRGERAKRKAVSLLHVPYTRRKPVNAGR
jgi:site-specific recombinase XerD